MIGTHDDLAPSLNMLVVKMIWDGFTSQNRKLHVETINLTILISGIRNLPPLLYWKVWE